MLPERREIARIAVCEDDEATRELLCDNLTADGYTALPGGDASDALRICSYNQPDLLLLDLILPDAAGLDVLREIRDADGVSARFDPSLPIVTLSGRGTVDDRVRGLDAGADDYLVKASASVVGRTASGVLWKVGKMKSSSVSSPDVRRIACG